MSRTILIAVSPGELWAALCDDGEPVELRIARDGAVARVGEIILGRIVALEPALPAARVEIGLQRPAFLGAEDGIPGQGLAGLHEGEAVLVQVTKEARADKATGVSLRPRLGGAFLDYLPAGTIEIVARGLDEATRRRLMADVGGFARPGEGFHVRAAAVAASAESLAADADALRRRWQAIERARSGARPPARLEPEEPPVVTLLASLLPPPPERILIDDRAAFAEARSFLLRRHPDLAPRLEFHDGQPLFEQEAMAAAIETALAPRVALAGGGAITIEATAAATLIDVDSGGAGLMATNLAAARAAARQIRLRNIAGAIVIDFIAMTGRGQRERVAAALERALASDPAEPERLGWTRLGHFELVRKRRHPALEELLFERAPDGGRVKTALTVALEALRALAREAKAAPARARALRVPPDVASALIDGGARGARLALEARLGRPIAITAEARGRGFDIGGG